MDIVRADTVLADIVPMDIVLVGTVLADIAHPGTASADRGWGKCWEVERDQPRRPAVPEEPVEGVGSRGTP